MRQIYHNLFSYDSAYAALTGMGIGPGTLTYLIIFIFNFRPFNLAISTKLYNFAAVIESRFLYNLRAFSSPAEGVRLPISLMVRMLNCFWWGFALLEEGKKML